MKKLFSAALLTLLLSTGLANATSLAVEMQIADRCLVDNKINKHNADTRKFTKYLEITDRVQRETIIDIITEYKFSGIVGQPYPNVTVEKIGIMEAPNGSTLIIFADVNDCVWSYYTFDKEDSKEFFIELAKRGA